MKHTKVWWADLPDEVLVESAWEREMHMAGINSYENSRIDAKGKARAASETRAGKKMIRNMVKKTTVAIEKMQRTVLKKTRTDRELKGTVILVPAESLAIITIKILLDVTYSATKPEIGAKYQSACNKVAKAVEMELNFRHWVKESKAGAKEWAKAEGLSGTPKSMAEKLIEEEGMSKRTANRWKKTFDELCEYKWDTLEEHYCGDALLDTVCEANPEVFEKYLERRKRANTNYIRLTEEFRSEFDELEGQIAGMQVTKKPMISRPNRWVKQGE